MVGFKHVLGFVVVSMLPATASAQFMGPAFNPCNRCGPIAPPPMVSVCPPVVQQPVMQTRIVPRVQTTYRQEQYTTYRPVTTTQIRREAVQVNVPVTTHRQVTVDEGGYKMVWVPKMVTKTVAETKLQQQVQYRDVPYQVVQQVPQTHTRLVPQQTVQYHTQHVALARTCCQPGMQSALVLPSTTALAPVAMPQTAVNSAPVPSPYSAPAAQQQAAAATDSGEWQKVPQRNADATSEIQLQNYQTVQSIPVPSAQGMFSRPTQSVSALRAGLYR